MSADLKTRRLIVSVPNISGEEADVIASGLEEVLPIRFGRSITGTVTHALGESLPDALACYVSGDRIVLGDIEQPRATPPDVINARAFTADEARQLAGALLAHAETVEAADEAEGPQLRKGICQHCGNLIEREGDLWIEPAADGDDSMWRETCADHETFTAQHEPYPAATIGA